MGIGHPGTVSKRRRTSRRPHPAASQRPAPLALVPAPDPAGADPAQDPTAGPDPTTSAGIDHQQIQMLIGLIATGGLDEHLPTIGAAIGERHRQRQRAQSNQAAARIDIGDRVRLNHDIRPLYLHGATGTVTGWAGQRVVVQLDEPTGRFTNGQIRCPPLGLEPLPT